MCVQIALNAITVEASGRLMAVDPVTTDPPTGIAETATSAPAGAAGDDVGGGAGVEVFASDELECELVAGELVACLDAVGLAVCAALRSGS